MKNLLVLALSTSCALGLHAAEVDTANITTFTSGTAAKASEVNSTISALTTAIDDNAATIATLQSIIEDYETEITSLQASVEALQTATSNDVTGNKYRVIDVGSGTLVENSWGASIHSGVTAIANFAEDGNLYITDYAFNEVEIELESDCAQDPDTYEWDCEDRAVNTSSDSASLTGTWSQVGNTITANIDGDTVTWVVSDNSGTLVSIDIYDFDATDSPAYYQTSVLIGVKITE